MCFLTNNFRCCFSIKANSTFLAARTEETLSEMEIKEFEPRFKSAKTRFKFSAGLILETFDTILSGTTHIKTAA